MIIEKLREVTNVLESLGLNEVTSMSCDMWSEGFEVMVESKGIENIEGYKVEKRDSEDYPYEGIVKIGNVKLYCLLKGDENDSSI